jgi:hypothetical protein
VGLSLPPASLRFATRWGDTMIEPLMRSTMALTGLALLSACGESRIDIVVLTPEDLSDAVASLSLQILSPPQAAPYDCEDIAFDEVSDLTLQLTQTQEIALRPGGYADLSGIPRQGEKLFFASALDADGAPLAHGCAAQGEIEGDAAITIELAHRPVLALPDHPFDRPLPRELEVVVTDALGRPLAETTLDWRLVGPGGEALTGEATSDEAGRTQLELPAPRLPGPAALEVGARWARNRPPSTIAFSEPAGMLRHELSGAIERGADTSLQRSRYVVGRVGPDGQMGFAALGPIARREEPREVVVAYVEDGALHAAAAELPPQTFALGLLPDGDRERVVSIAPDVWLEIGPPDDDALPVAESPLEGDAAGAIVRLAECGGDEQEAILAQRQSALVAFGPDGSPAPSPFDTLGGRGTLVHAGCVADLDGTARRVVVLQPRLENETLIAADFDGRLRVATLEASAVTVGFAPSLDDAPPALLAHTSGLTGNAIARYRLAPAGDAGLDLVAIDIDAAPQFPLSVAGADVDGDGRVDVVALYLVGLEEDVSAYRTGIHLGLDHRGARLAGMSPTAHAVSPQLFAADFNGNGRDDLVIATPFEVRILLMDEARAR